MNLQDKLKLWVDITGVNPQEANRSYSIYMDGRLSDWDIKRMNDRIMECLKYDETGMFAETYLEVYLKKFLENKSVSIMELIENSDLSNFIKDVRTLYDAIKETDASSIILSEAKKAMEFYQLPCDKLTPFSVVELRQSAMNCMNGKLSLRQFSYGAIGSEFKVSKDIYLFKNLDNLIVSAAKGSLNGVSLAYIQDDERITDSYFAFVVKNGGNLYLLSDMPQYAHPAQRNMTRCPGRDMSNRIESNWFPYNTVAGLDTSDLWNSGRYGISGPKNEVSTRLNEDMLYASIGTIDKLEQDEAFWFVMMISLIKEKFYDNEIPKLDISYTKSMINSPLIEQSSNALVVQKELPHMNLSEITIKDTENLTYERTPEDNTIYYQYLIDRYADRIDTEILNVIANTEKGLMVEDKFARKDSFGRKIGCDYLSLDLDMPKTEEEVIYQQKWIARYNFAKAVTKIAEEEYKKKNSTIQKTIGEYITPRIGRLAVMHLQGKLLGRSVIRKNFGNEYTNEQIPISKIYEFDNWYSNDYRIGNYCYGFYGYNKADIKCAFTQAKAGVVLQIEPKNADELAMVCGITKEELPVELQNYDSKIDKYYGNPILDNIDPFHWKISDEFNEMRFAITIIMSKEQYLEFCKEAGVEPVKFWLREKPKCFVSKNSDQNMCRGSIKSRWVGVKLTRELCKKCTKCKWYSIEEK